MGHRHVFSTSPIFETNHDQLWDHMHPEEPYVHLASSSDVESNSFFQPGDNLHNDGSQCVSHQNPSAGVNEMSSSCHIVHALHNQSDGSSTHSSVAVDAFHVPDNHVHQTPRSNYIVENSAFDLTVGTNGRGQYKRKSPMIPSINEIGGTSQYYCAGSSSDASFERQNVDFQHNHWESIAMPPSYNPPIGGESSLRNVRSRSSFELDPDMFRPHTLTNYPHHSSSSRNPTERCEPVDHSSPGPMLPFIDRNHIHMSTASHGRTIVADSGNLSQDASPFIGSSAPDIPGQVSGYSHDPPSSSRNPAILQRFRPTSAQARGARSSYPQRPNLTNRAGMGSVRLGQAPPVEEGLRFVAVESSSNRRPRALPSAGWRNSDRSRSRLLADRYRAFSVDAVVHDHMTPEGMMFVDRSSLHGSRGPFDQHRELMLDVDSMSYEELLALGERIGSVSTGLSDDQLSKCLKVTVYLSSEQVLMEERCVICLEEYQDMEEIGSLRSCGHEYHVGCIKKWLSMKNLCPICKAPALSDDMKKDKMKAPI